MIQTVEAVIEKDGTVRLLQGVVLPGDRRALVVAHLAVSPGGHTLAVACNAKCVVVLDIDL